MARIRIIEEEDADEATRAFYGELRQWLKPFPGPRAQNPKVPQIWRVLANNLELARYVNGGTQYFLSRWPWGQQNIRLRQMIIFTITRRLGCEYAYAGNWPVAEKAGMRREQYDAFADLDGIADSPLFNEEEKLLIGYVNSLGRHANANDALFGRMAAHFGDVVAYEITAFVGFRMLTSTLINTLEIRDD